MDYPKESGRICICELDNGDVIDSEFVICQLGRKLAYFKEVINTGRYVVAWKYKESEV